MKITVVSDIHLEFGDIDLDNKQGADVLILSGDIALAHAFTFNSHKGFLMTQFFSRVSKAYKHVIYIFGNHEHYHWDYLKTEEVIRGMLDGMDGCENIHVLECQSVELDGIAFVGGTLWTDFNKDNPTTKWDAERGMNDFQCVTYGNRNFTPDDAIKAHRAMLLRIDQEVANQRDAQQLFSRGKPIVVVGHHAPSFQSIDTRRYSGDRLNGAYASDLQTFIEERPEIVLWTHGHIHKSSDYMIGKTRVFANPRGYAGHRDGQGGNDKFDQHHIIEV